MRKTVFEILGIEPTNDLKLVEKACRVKKQKLDEEKSKNPEDQKKVEAAFEELVAAYEQVNTSKKLSEYHLTLLNTTPQKSTATAAPAVAFFSQSAAPAAAAETPQTKFKREQKRREALFRGEGFNPDRSKTGFIEIFIPVDVAEKLTPDGKNVAIEIRFVGQNGQLSDHIIGTNGPDSMDFARLATALTEISALSHFQFGHTYSEAVDIAKNKPGNLNDDRIAIVKICVPADTLSIQKEDIYACMGMMPPLRENNPFKACIFAKGSRITSSQIAEIKHLTESEYDLRKSMSASSTFLRRLAGSTTVNPAYVSPTQEEGLRPMVP